MMFTRKKDFGDYAFEKNSKPIIEWANSAIEAIQLRIRKEGRSYLIATKVEGEPTKPGGKKMDWVEVEKLTSLRIPGKSLAIFVGQQKLVSTHTQIKGGETLANVDWVKIETLE